MKKLSLLSILMATFSLLFTQSALAACGEIVLGSAISLTGKYATNGIHAKNGYEHAIQKIKDAGFGAEGVSRVTTQAVVYTSIAVLLWNYLITAVFI